MVKGKQKAKSKSKVTKNPHLQSRVEYLHKAAQYLGEAKDRQSSKEEQHVSQAHAAISTTQTAVGDTHSVAEHQSDNLTKRRMRTDGSPRYLINQERSVALKAQIRLPRDVKRGVCKQCDTPLVDGKSSSTRLENLSRGKKKQWADVLVVTCLVCHCQKRFPVGAAKQPKNKARQAAKVDKRVGDTSTTPATEE